MPVQIPECPSLPPISSFQDLTDQLSMFCTCVSLLAFWFALLVPLDVPLDFDVLSSLVPLPENEGSLLDHDLLCLPLPYDCLCLCVHCSLVENVLHCTHNIHRADSMILLLWQTRES